MKTELEACIELSEARRHEIGRLDKALAAEREKVKRLRGAIRGIVVLGTDQHGAVLVGPVGIEMARETEAACD